MSAPTQKAFPVSWDQFHRDARALAWRLAGAGPFEAIVCITRGGLVPAAIVARELGTRLIETVCVASYHDYQSQGELVVLKDVAPAVKTLGDGSGRGVLVVDDLTDTGKTAKIVRDILPNAHFATVYAKPAGRPMVDTFVTEVSQDTWIYFPWGHGARLPGADQREHAGVAFRAPIPTWSAHTMTWSAAGARRMRARGTMSVSACDTPASPLRGIAGRSAS